MVQRRGGARRKTRHKLSKSHRQNGKLSITEYLKSFNIGDRVGLRIEPSIQKGVFSARFHGQNGVVKDKRGKCYIIALKDGKKQKTIIAHAIHLNKTK